MNENGKNYRERADRELGKRLDEFVRQLGVAGEAAESSATGKKTSPQSAPNRAARKPAKETDKRSPSAIHAGHRERLRKSALRDKRLESFSDVEILETLLSFIIPQRDTNVTAHRLLDKFGTLIGVMTADVEELYRVSGMTNGAATLLPALWRACKGENKFDLVLRTRNDAINFFGALYLGGVSDGMCFAFTDDESRLIALEQVEAAPEVSYRAAVGSAIKYGARGVLPVWFGRESIGIGYDAVTYVKNLATALDSIDVMLLDIIMLTDYGYYTPGPRNVDYGGWVPQYVFVPERNYARAPRAFEVVHDVADDSFEPIAPHLISAFLIGKRDE